MDDNIFDFNMYAKPAWKKKTYVEEKKKHVSLNRSIIDHEQNIGI